MTLWDERDYPILEAFAELEAAGAFEVNVADFATTLGRESQDTWVGMQSLRDADYIAWDQEQSRMTGERFIAAPRVLERGRRTLGQWPKDEYTSLVSILEARIEASDDPDERSKLTKVRDGLVGMGRDATTELLAAFLRQAAGL